MDAADLHHELESAAGEAHSLQRLAELHLMQGDKETATELLRRALPLARWSIIGLHLLQRIYGTMIAAAPDRQVARAIVDRAEATMGEQDECPFCNIMLAVPAATACADVGDVDSAKRYLSIAEESEALWAGTSWHAHVLEAQAHIAMAEGFTDEARRLIAEAAEHFLSAGQPLDAKRCQAGLEPSLSTAAMR